MPTDDLRLELTLPDHRVALGPLTIDIVKQTLGVNLDQVLARLLEEPSTSVPPRHRRFLLRIPAGDGVVIPLRPMGEVGLSHARGGVLSITHPDPLQNAFATLLQARDIKTSEPQVLETDNGLVRQFFLRTTPGTSFTATLPVLGEIKVNVLPTAVATTA